MIKGDIYLVDFGKSKESFSFGKKRPALIFQTDKLNYAVKEGIYDYFLVIPLSTKNDILTSDFRVKISKREELNQDSFVVVNSICFLHKKYFIKKLTTLDKKEIEEIEKVLKDVFDIT
jgi:mRNA-degrading endonuclease toxin of MazEF toxin-antitoxin module